MTEISYRCFCAVGGLTNPRLSSRAISNRRGEHVRMAYYDSGIGPLTRAHRTMLGPPAKGETS